MSIETRFRAPLLQQILVGPCFGLYSKIHLICMQRQARHFPTRRGIFGKLYVSFYYKSSTLELAYQQQILARMSPSANIVYLYMFVLLRYPMHNSVRDFIPLMISFYCKQICFSE